MFNWHWPPSKLLLALILIIGVIFRWGIQIPLQDWANENAQWADQMHQVLPKQSKNASPFRDQAGFETYLDERVSSSNGIITEVCFSVKEAYAKIIVGSELPVPEAAREMVRSLALPISRLEVGVTNNQVLLSVYYAVDVRKDY